jgi:hypothetical protein
MTERSKTLAGVSALVLLGVLTAVLVYQIPVEAVLGTGIKLPIFHGASTWVNLATFTLMGLTAVAYMLTRRDGVYAWETGLRAVSAPLWLINSALGFISALNTWDFTGSQTSPFTMAMQDPRLRAQFWLLIAVGVLLIVQLLLDRRLYKAVADGVFVVVMWVLLADVFIDPAKRALHPDSPVLNSGSDIQLPFFGIVASLLAMALIIAWFVARRVGSVKDEERGADTPGAAEVRA